MNKPIFHAEAEKSILACCFESSECIPSVMKLITTEDFYIKEHQIVYDAIRDVFEKTNTGDIMAVAARIKEQDLVNRIGGLPFLYDIIKYHVADVVNWKYYVEIVKENSQMRHFRQALNKADSQITPDTFQEAIETVMRAIPKEVDMESDLIPEIYKDWYEKFLRGEDIHDNEKDMDTGLHFFDKHHTTGRRGSMMVIQGHPGAGKTSLLWNIFYHRLITGYKGLYFSTEFKRDMAVRWLAAQATGIKLWRLIKGERKYFDDDEMERLQEVYHNISRFGKGWLIDRGRPSLSFIKATAREKKIQDGLDFIVLDYLQHFSFPGKFDNRVQAMSDFLYELDALNKELGVQVILASQLSREARKMGKPVSWGGKGTGAIEEAAWVVGTLSGTELDPGNRGIPQEDWDLKAEHNEIYTLSITKDRTGPQGTMVPMVFEKECVRFRDLTIEEMDFYEQHSNGKGRY